MAKCSICNEKVGELFLQKKVGTYIKDEQGKLYLVCGKCQRLHNNDKKAMFERLV